MKKTKVGIVGCGAIGGEVARFIDRCLQLKAQVTALADKDRKQAENLAARLSSAPRILDIDSLIKKVDLVIEAAAVNAAVYILDKVIEEGKDLVILSVGALVKDLSVLARAEEKGIKIYIPSGAICGVDGLGALSLGKIKKITLVTSKPPAGLAGADYLRSERINLDKLKGEQIVFKGDVAQAIKHFPKNINVAATLLLVSSGAPVEVCIKANSKIRRNVHRIEIDAQAARVRVEVENIPSSVNPKTSALAILSTQYLLKKIFSSVKIGS